MQLIQRNKDSAYLQYDKYVNYDNPIVAAKAKELAADCKSSRTCSCRNDLQDNILCNA